MADAEMVKFNKALEKLCIDCAGDVKKELSTCKSSIIGRLEKLKDDMAKVAVPKSSPEDLEEVPALVSAILKRESSRFASILILTAAVRIDRPGGKVSVPAVGVSGPMGSSAL